MTTDRTPARLCQNCNRWFRFSNTSCTLDHGDACCHEHDTPAFPTDRTPAHQPKHSFRDPEGTIPQDWCDDCDEEWPCRPVLATQLAEAQAQVAARDSQITALLEILL